MHLLELHYDVLDVLSTYLASEHGLLGLMCTCRNAYHIFTPALYRDIETRTEKNTATLCSTLLAHPERILLIRTLQCAMHDLRPSQNNIAEVLSRAVNLQKLNVSLMEFFDGAPNLIAAVSQLDRLRSLSLCILPPKDCHTISRYISPHNLRSLHLEMTDELPDILHILAPFSQSLEYLRLVFPVQWGETIWCRKFEVEPSSMHWPRVDILSLVYVYLEQPAALAHVFPSVRSLDLFGQPSLESKASNGAVWPHLRSLEINSPVLACQLVDWKHTGAIDRMVFRDHWLGIGAADLEKAPIASVHSMLSAAQPKSLFLQLCAPLTSSVCRILAENTRSLHYLALHIRLVNVIDRLDSRYVRSFNSAFSFQFPVASNRDVIRNSQISSPMAYTCFRFDTSCLASKNSSPERCSRPFSDTSHLRTKVATSMLRLCCRAWCAATSSLGSRMRASSRSWRSSCCIFGRFCVTRRGW